MTDYTDGSTIRGIRLKTGRITYELRDEKGQPVCRGEFNQIRLETKAAGIRPKILNRIEEEV